jgi:hypothetical protein
MPSLKKTFPFALLLLAFLLRAWQLAAVPPGLTHDEAGHGHDAVHILKGVTLIYFTVGYGREPLFDYFNAGVIAGMGANPFTLRFSAVIWGMIALAATHRAARMMYGRETAALALALMAVSFWPLATSRQILRSAMLPEEMAVAVILFLKLTSKDAKGYWLLVIGLGAAVAASLYTYIPARILWLMFPLAVITSYVMRRTNYQLPFTNYKSQFSNLQSLVSLPLAFLLASPLFLYLYQHPEAEQRLGMLSAPLTALQNGDPSLLFNNMKETLLALFLPGHGDHFLAYNIPGKPIYDPVTAILAAIGLLILVWQLVNSKQYSVNSPKRSLFTVHCLLLYWLALGLAPALITGPEALTTRIIGAQPVLYILPAIGVSFIVSRLTQYTGRITHSASYVAYCVLILTFLITTARDYFFVWAQSPGVRAAYQSTLIAMLKTIDGPTVISTVYPSATHDPYIGEMLTQEETRWIDGRLGMLLPISEGWRFAIPDSTPPHRKFELIGPPLDTVNLRPTDLDPHFDIMPMATVGLDMDSPVKAGGFNDSIATIGYQWLDETYRPGDLAEFMLWLFVFDSRNIGPIHPPAFKTDLNLFTHVLNPDGSIFLQQDRLDAPSWQWQAGDTIIQIHQFAIPLDAAPGEYQVIVGLYDRITGERLLTEDGADHVNVDSLIIR